MTYLLNLSVQRSFCDLQASLKSLTITECGNLFAEADFAALAALSQLQTLHIDTDAQVHPQSTAALSTLISLKSLSLTVDPGDRMDYANISKYSGFPWCLMLLTTLTSLRTSGWTYVGQLPDTISILVELRALCLPNCVLTGLPGSLAQLIHLEKINLTSNALGRCVPIVTGSVLAVLVMVQLGFHLSNVHIGTLYIKAWMHALLPSVSKGFRLHCADQLLCKDSCSTR